VGSGSGQEAIDRPPGLLAAATAITRVRGGRMQVTPASAKSVLDSVGARMEESRDITRYIANLLIFLGLLGTFFGLATTVPAVVETIRSLQPTERRRGQHGGLRTPDERTRGPAWRHGHRLCLLASGARRLAHVVGLAGALMPGMGRTASTVSWKSGSPRSRA
jgi:hypothetical protein